MIFSTFMERFKHKRSFSPEGEGGAGGGTGGAGTGDSGTGGDNTADDFDPVRDFGKVDETKTEEDEGFGILLDGIKAAQTEAQKAESLKASAQQITPEKQKEMVTGMHQQLQNAIANVKLPDDMFAADFDPSDAGQIQTAITKSVKFAIQQAVGMAMFPTSQAIEQMQTSLMAQVKTLMTQNLSGNNESQRLQNEFPLIADPVSGPLFVQMNEHMVKAKKPYAERLKALRGFAQRLELNAGPQKRESTGVLTGADALDELFRT